ncbi:OsmC family protein [Pseudoruegeria sp. HB172150]|uniref:OsmC family protein n=1 Tax=Pseudoruegeria sp. HB172150 TaxID=2721164 RepID=UPI00155697D1|nr:OsmC family protein [Pseudoruegeria sp. HB172150]
MTRHIGMSFRTVSGTAAGLGMAGGRSVVADRPEGVAGGRGLGFEGGELMAAALGGCFWNELNFAAHESGLQIAIEALDAEVELAGTPPRVARARVCARLSGADETTLQAVFDAARDSSIIANSITDAIPVMFERLPG